MTREEEIEEIAIAFAIDEIKDTCNSASKRGLLYVGFITGAEWADEHPVSYDGKAMLYVNNKSHENGYKEAVDKACKWLEEFMQMTPSKKTFLKRFRQAMEGE